jgi:hypothetical protein
MSALIRFEAFHHEREQPMPTNDEEVYRDHHTISRALAMIVGASFLLLATIALYAGGSRLLAARTSARWPETDGLIIESRAGSNCTHCWPTINYYYTVASQSFVGSNITAGTQDYYNRGEANAKASSYTVGSKLAVYYDPKDPAVSCLEPGVLRWFTYLYLTLAGCLMNAGLFLFRRLKRSTPKGNKAVPPAGIQTPNQQIMSRFEGHQ